ncbi:hypothetical protein BS78_02G074800 [Paspalum vaginatum]|nr:hypothetical protein BS78_02G074800 [Paspalum vaginatum]
MAARPPSAATAAGTTVGAVAHPALPPRRGRPGATDGSGLVGGAESSLALASPLPLELFYCRIHKHGELDGGDVLTARRERRGQARQRSGAGARGPPERRGGAQVLAGPTREVAPERVGGGRGIWVIYSFRYFDGENLKRHVLSCETEGVLSIQPCPLPVLLVISAFLIVTSFSSAQ